MILGFKEKFPWGEPTFFREKILLGVKNKQGTPSEIKYTHADGKKLQLERRTKVIYPKIHTIREGTRWEPFIDIHMAYGVRTTRYEQFNSGISDIEVCKGVQRIVIDWASDTLPLIYIDDRKDVLPLETMHTLIRNDGFDNVQDFRRWFKKKFHGQLIHWTTHKY